jgi:hypothetical protein
MTSSRRDLTTFYFVVMLIALAGQALAAVEWLGWPLVPALAAVAALELGGVVLSRHALTRQQLGERAVASRTLSAAVAGFAVAFNWLGHTDHRQGAFFAGMSALGYLVWLLDAGSRRRDQLRARGMLAQVPPAYGLAQWLRHPWLTREARALAVATPALGLHGSVTAARDARRRTARHAAIATLLRRKLSAGKDTVAAELAIATYDLDEIAARLAAAADYDGLTALLGADLTPAAVVGVEVPAEPKPSDDREPVEKPFVPATAETVPAAAPSSAPTSAPPATRRRTVGETYRLAEALIKGDPDLSRAEVADTLGISTRRLREVLNLGRASAAADEELRQHRAAEATSGPTALEAAMAAA